ncbi:hypothetical protein L0F63_005449 [Massospora cicadina]|nr:hypothetical protein L0F63_005449 [Massospora cicadina]
MPVCYSCNSSRLKCTWERQHTKKYVSHSKKGQRDKPLGFKHYTYQEPRNLNEVEPFGKVAKKRGGGRVARPLPPFTASALVAILRTWQLNSNSRQDFHIIMKLCDFRLEEATRQDFRSVCQIFDRKARVPLEDGVLYYFDLGSREVLSLLALAEDRYFECLNPSHFLFPRRLFNSRPRSLLLRLTVWRAGLQFTPASPFRDAVAYFIEAKISSMVCLSRTKPDLDTLQSYLVIGIGITVGCSSKLCNKWPYLNTFLSLVHQLGLHKVSPLPEEIQLERLLAYRVAFSWDSKSIWSLGFQNFSLGTYYHPNPRASNNAIRFYTSRLKKGAVPDVSGALDLCGLITSECITRSSFSLLHLDRLAFKAKEEALPNAFVLRVIDLTLKEIYSCYVDSLKRLRKIQTECDATGRAPYATIFSQAMCLISIEYHFSRVQIISFRASCAEDDGLILPGLVSSVLAIQIISRSPFQLIRVNPFTLIFHFIMKHYHAYHTSPKFKPSHSRLKPEELTNALVTAHAILKGKASYGLHCLYNSLSIIMFEFFVSKYNIGLPGYLGSSSNAK